jgi:hypothetical protein
VTLYLAISFNAVPDFSFLILPWIVDIVGMLFDVDTLIFGGHAIHHCAIECDIG